MTEKYKNLLKFVHEKKQDDRITIQKKPSPIVRLTSSVSGEIRSITHKVWLHVLGANGWQENLLVTDETGDFISTEKGTIRKVTFPYHDKKGHLHYYAFSDDDKTFTPTEHDLYTMKDPNSEKIKVKTFDEIMKYKTAKILRESMRTEPISIFMAVMILLGGIGIGLMGAGFLNIGGDNIEVNGSYIENQDNDDIKNYDNGTSTKKDNGGSITINYLNLDLLNELEKWI